MFYIAKDIYLLSVDLQLGFNMSSRNETDSSSEEEEEEEEEEDVLPTHPRWVRGSANFADFSFHPSKYDLATVNMDGYLEV